MSEPFRHGPGSLVDEARPIDFTFDDHHYRGRAGDTLASALLANGVHLLGRSLKYHRPRGIFAAGEEEPNALVHARTPTGEWPNTPATTLSLHDGLRVHSQNRWPSLRWHAGAAAGMFAPLLSAGFYYKTFIAPAQAWPAYERLLRRAAGLGRAPLAPETSRSDKRHRACDVLVVGGGAAGLMAARAATACGARVVLADAGNRLGGALHETDVRIDGQPAPVWAHAFSADLAACPELTVLTRARVSGLYRGGVAVIAQTHSDGNQRLYTVRAARIILACGGIERPLLFANNDRPGIMLAGAARRYIRAYGVLPGRRAVVLQNNDSAVDTVRALRSAGATVVAVADVRERAALPADVQDVPLLNAARVSHIGGRRHITGMTLTSGARRHRLACDLLTVSGGWTPVVHLLACLDAPLHFDETWGAFRPVAGATDNGVDAAGVCNGGDGLEACMQDGERAGLLACERLGLATAITHKQPTVVAPHALASWRGAGTVEVGGGERRGKCFVDLQNDVTTADLAQALREGYQDIEHVKRYTTLGMGTEQGRTSQINGMQVVAARLGQPPESVGITTARPPVSAVSLAALAGREHGERLAPTRRSPLHDCHVAADAAFMPSGLWLRPRYYRCHGRDPESAAIAEARTVRQAVGIADVSTLGKIEVHGNDAAAFVNRIYMNGCARTAVGRARYGVMLRDDGFVFDDGTVIRLAPDRFAITTTTINAEAVLSHIEFYRQAIWPELSIRLTPVTEQWAVVAIAGPLSRELLHGIWPALNLSGEGLPFLGVQQIAFRGEPARIARVTFSGERAYEVAVPADYGEALWEALLAEGRQYGVAPYGLEAMDYMRVEKGHVVVGAEIDGRTSPYDLGMGRMVRANVDFVGARSLACPVFADPGRPRLMGFVARANGSPIPAGAQVLARPHGGRMQTSLGRVTSPAYSVALDRPVALGLLAGAAVGDELIAASPVTGEQSPVTVSEPVFHDPSGSRARD
ncbi:2Fe-2S iron-sulfur cluster-binding protein [Arhodomonas sp. AD133]|uniref:2Fe-2S iron-sulfur cluster-binding protein n=1 Tax=Arhodomonas sp. AD133 TaxID=3415009 RepID=UPI003EBF6DB8